MGISFAPSYANLVLFELEYDLISFNRLNGNILLFFRYIDDIFCLLRENFVLDFISSYNSFHVKIQLNCSQNTQSISFLDLNIHLAGSFLSVSPYYKVFNKFLYLPFSSFHTRATKLGFIKSECTRLAIASTFLADFHRATASFAIHLKMRGYPVHFIELSFAKVTHSDRFQYIRPRLAPIDVAPIKRPIQTFLILPYFPEFSLAAKSLNSAWTAREEELSRFMSRPMVSWRIHSTLQSIYAKFTTFPNPP